jgi:hypothetical protein
MSALLAFLLDVTIRVFCDSIARRELAELKRDELRWN